MPRRVKLDEGTVAWALARGRGSVKDTTTALNPVLALGRRRRGRDESAALRRRLDELVRAQPVRGATGSPAPHNPADRPRAGDGLVGPLDGTPGATSGTAGGSR